MPDQTFIACPHCGEPVVMSAMQRELFHGRTLACVRCAKPFTVSRKATPLYEVPPDGARWGVRLQPTPAAEGASEGPPEAAGEDDLPAVASPAPPATKPAAGRALGTPMIALIVIGCLLLIGGGVAAIVGPIVSRSRANAQRLQCGSNLQAIGIALASYAATHQQYPDTLERLLTAGLVTPSMLVCPATADTPAPGSSPQAQIASLRNGRHLSYVYVGDRLTPAQIGSPTQVLLYEPLSHHGPGPTGGMNVLHANGAVSFAAPQAAQQILAGLPPPLPKNGADVPAGSGARGR